MRGSGRKGTAVSPFLAPFLFFLWLAIFSSIRVQAQGTATSASLNDPSLATGTPSNGIGGTDSNSSSSSAATSVVPIPLSSQPVPFLLKTPQSTSNKQVQRDAYFTGCSDSSSVVYVSSEKRLNISTIYSQFDQDKRDSAMGNGDPIQAGVLRIVGIGSVGNQSYAFNSYTDSTGATTGLLSGCQCGRSPSKCCHSANISSLSQVLSK